MRRRRRWTCSSNSRRASRFWRCRSRLEAFDTRANSIERCVPDRDASRCGAGARPARWYRRCREPRRPEVRRHVRRRPRPHQGGGRPHRRHPPVGPRRRRGRVRHGQDDRRARAAGLRGVVVPGAREMDMLLTSGERTSIALLCMAIIDRGEPSVSFTGSQAGIVTDTTHTRAKILDVRADRLRAAVEAGNIAVVAGFQGVSTASDITTLGRGGSDTTAVALAAALGAEACEIYTDVVGRLHRGSEGCAARPDAGARLLRRDARDGRDRRPRARAPVGRVRAQPRRARPRAVELHLGTRHVGRRGRTGRVRGVEREWSRRSSRESPTTCPRRR